MLASLLRAVVDLYVLLLLGRAIASWLPLDRDSAPLRFLHELTEPVLAPLRRVLPTAGGLDFSPVVALLLLEVVRRLLLG